MHSLLLQGNLSPFIGACFVLMFAFSLGLSSRQKSEHACTVILLTVQSWGNVQGSDPAALPPSGSGQQRGFLHQPFSMQPGGRYGNLSWDEMMRSLSDPVFQTGQDGAPIIPPVIFPLIFTLLPFRHLRSASASVPLGKGPASECGRRFWLAVQVFRCFCVHWNCTCQHCLRYRLKVKVRH